MKKVLDGFDFTVDREKYRFTDEDFARMEEALEVETLTEERRQVLQGLCDFYVSFAESWKLAPRSKKIHDRLEKIHKDAGRLIKTLLALHDPKAPDRPARQATIEYLHNAAPENDWAENGDDLFKFMKQVCGVMEAARDAQKNLPKDKVGRPGDPPLGRLVQDLARFYRHVTGERPHHGCDPYDDRETPYKGHFFKLVKAFLTPLRDYSERSHLGLGKFIQRTLAELESKDGTPGKT